MTCSQSVQCICLKLYVTANQCYSQAYTKGGGNQIYIARISLITAVTFTDKKYDSLSLYIYIKLVIVSVNEVIISTRNSNCTYLVLSFFLVATAKKKMLPCGPCFYANQNAWQGKMALQHSFHKNYSALHFLSLLAAVSALLFLRLFFWGGGGIFC